MLVADKLEAERQALPHFDGQRGSGSQSLRRRSAF